MMDPGQKSIPLEFKFVSFLQNRSRYRMESFAKIILNLNEGSKSTSPQKSADVLLRYNFIIPLKLRPYLLSMIMSYDSVHFVFRGV